MQAKQHMLTVNNVKILVGLAQPGSYCQANTRRTGQAISVTREYELSFKLCTTSHDGRSPTKCSLKYVEYLYDIPSISTPEQDRYCQIRHSIATTTAAQRRSPKMNILPSIQTTHQAS